MLFHVLLCRCVFDTNAILFHKKVILLYHILFVEPIAIYANVTQYYAIVHTTVTLNCEITQGTAWRINWHKDDDLALITNSFTRFSGGTVETESLTITDVQTSDGGTYICQGIDAVYDTTVNTDTIHVTIVGKHTFNLCVVMR